MKIIKFFLLASLLSILLVSTVSAISVSGGRWEDNSSSATIINGESIGFNYYFSHYFTSSMDISIKLLDSSGNLVHTFLDKTVSNEYYFNEKPVMVTSQIYGNEGNYILIFSSKDSDNTNAVSIYLTVNPAHYDITPPTIEILGDNPVYHEVGTSYNDAGATAFDNVDGDLTSEIIVTSNVDENVLGTYSVIYSVSDSAGNTATEARVVYVIDTISPVITLLGDNPQTITLGETYVEQGATASDNYDGNITNLIEINSSEVDVSVEGTYEVIYSVSDSSGNTATEIRIVNVISPDDDGNDNGENGNDNDDEDDENDDDTTTTKSTGDYYQYQDPDEDAYWEQFEITTTPEIDLDEDEEPRKNWLVRLIESIINFFKRLFGLR